MKYEPKIELYFPEEIKSGLDRIQKVYKGWALEDVDIDKLLEGIDQAIEDNTKADTEDNTHAIAVEYDSNTCDYTFDPYFDPSFDLSWDEIDEFFVDDETDDIEDEELFYSGMADMEPCLSLDEEENDENICSSEDDYHLSELDDFDREDATEVIRAPITETIIIESHGYRRG